MPLTITTLEITGRQALVNFANGAILENYPTPRAAQGPFPDSPNVIPAGQPVPSVTPVSVTPFSTTNVAPCTNPSEALSYLALQGWNLAFVIGTTEFPVYYLTHS